MDWTLLVEKAYRLYWHTSRHWHCFNVSMFHCVLNPFSLVFASLQTSLLLIVGELAGEGSVVFAVSDK